MKGDIKNFVIIIVCIVIFLFTIGFAFVNGYIEDQGLIISFFGILATFVVITNYAQAKEAKDKVDAYQKEMEKIKKDIYDEDEKPKFQLADNNNEKKINEIAARYFAGQDLHYRQLIEETFNRLASVHYIDLIKTIAVQDGRYTCKVNHPLSRTAVKATACLEGGKIVFRNRNAEPIYNVTMVDSNAYDELEAMALLQLWQKISLPSDGSERLNALYKTESQK